MIIIKKLMKLSELVSSENLERLRRLFKTVTGVPIVFIDAEGVLLTEIDDPLCYCGALVSQKVEGTVCLRRRRWDVPEVEIEQQLREERAKGQPIPHHCRGGFRDMAVPIVVEDQTIGYAVFARTLTEPPDLAKFRRLATEGGMPPEMGEQVASHVLVMSEQRIEAIADFLRVITGLVASAAYDQVRARRILELEDLRDDLIHMMVHDLRTPLSSVIAALQTVIDYDYDGEVAHEFVPVAIAGARTLVDMVGTLLDINKMESGQMELNLSATQFNEVAQRALSQVKGLAREHRHHLRADLDPGCPPLEVDADKVRRVLINLLGNAIKFTPDGGHIALNSHCDADGLVFSVSDDGPGIPAEYKDHIFEKFGQVRSAEGAMKHSTGLGLTFCRMVAEASGGCIWVDSEVGRGSTFSVFIPVRQ